MWFGFMVFSATFINMSVISWRSVLLVEETGVEPNYQLIDLCIRIAKDYNFQLRTTGCTKVLDYLCTGRTIKTMCLLF
jgi:hypothetical protein